MAAPFSGITDGHSSVDRRAMLGRVTARGMYDRRAFAGHLLVVAT